MGQFTVSNITKLTELKEGQTLKESDFALVNPVNGEFIQMIYHDEDEIQREKIPINTGIWGIKKNMSGLYLMKEELNNDNILETFVHTEHITKRIDQFFSKEDIYKQLGFEIAKRGILLWGPAGTGKTTIINKISRKYIEQNDTAVIIWPTDQYDPHDVKQLFKCFDYRVKRVILVCEDLGGTEIAETRMRSDSSLLSLLDNQEKTFSITTLIIATTNHPEMFLGNLTNRPQRFDDVIEVGFPNSSERTSLLKFFAQRELDKDEQSIMNSKQAEGLTPAHLKEAVIRSKIYDQSISESLKQLITQIENFNKAFQKRTKMGFE